MPTPPYAAGLAAAKAGVTTGEWSNVLRGVFGEYRAPTGVSSTARQVGGALDAMAADAVLGLLLRALATDRQRVAAEYLRP